MSLILRPPWTRQPQVAVGIDGANPLAKGLIAAWLGSTPRGTYADGTPALVTETGTSSYAGGRFGLSRSNDRGQYLATSRTYTYPASNTPLTIAAWVKPAGGGTAIDAIASLGADVNYSQFALYTNVVSNADIYLSTVGNDVYTSGGKFTGVEWLSVVATFDGTGNFSTSTAKIYVNGISQSLSGAGSVNALSVTSGRSIRLYMDQSTNSRAFRGSIGPVIIAQRGWSAADVVAFHSNPWQLWKPIERRIWVPSAGAGGQTLTPDLFSNTNTFYSHTVTTGAVTLTPDLFTNTNNFYTHTVSSNYSLTPDLFTNSNTFYSATVTNLSTLYPDLFTNSETFYTHVVTGGGGQTLEPELFSNSATFYGPTITVGSVTLTASLFTNTNDIYSHTVTSNYPLTPDLFSNSSSFYTPTISVGAVTLTPSLFTNSSTFYTHTISHSSTTIYFWKRTA